LSNRRGLCLVLSAPSGAGKTTLSRALLAEDANLSLSISVTTRAPRAGEVDGEHYHFITQEKFDEMVLTGDLLEHAYVFGRSYGTPRDQIEQALAAGHDILFDIDWQGYRQLQASLPGDVVGVFIKPPSLAALHERLIKRGDDPEHITRRMAQAENEIAHAHEFDFLIENATFETALANLRAVLRATRLATHRMGEGRK
jgi:guanylate kinase